MPATLGETLSEARRRRGWSLREVERRSGIHNAHLSQIESRGIGRPDPAILWTLAEIYDLRYTDLMRLAGHAGEHDQTEGRRSLVGAALRALEDLAPQEQEEVLDFMDQVRKRKRHEG